MPGMFEGDLPQMDLGGAGPELLQRLSGNELGDLGEAFRLQPNLFAPPPRSWKDDLAEGLNSSVRSLGILFHNDALIDDANRFEKQRIAERQAGMIDRLVPVLAEASARRAKEAATGKAEEADEKRRARLYQFGLRASERGIIDEGGKTRALTPAERIAVAKAANYGFENPDANPEEIGAQFPPGFREMSEQELSDMAETRQRRLAEESADRVDARAARREGAAEGRAAARDAAREAREAEKQAQRDRADAVKDYRRTREANLSAIRTKAFEVGAKPEDINKEEAKEIGSIALRASKDILSDSAAWDNVSLMSSVRNDLPVANRRAWGSALAKAWRDAGLEPSSKQKTFLESLLK